MKFSFKKFIYTTCAFSGLFFIARTDAYELGSTLPDGTEYSQDNDTEATALSNSRLAAAWDAYNSEIADKMEKNLLTDYLANMTNCASLNIAMMRDFSALDGIELDIKTNYQDDKNKTNELFTTKLDNYISIIKNTYTAKINRCSSSNAFNFNLSKGNSIDAPNIIAL